MGLATLDKAVRRDSTVREDAPALAAVAVVDSAVVAAEAAVVEAAVAEVAAVVRTQEWRD